MSNESCLVTFARNRIAYTVAKCLAKRGIDIVTSDSVFPAMSFFSKYSKAYFLYPSYTQHPMSFIRTLLKYVKSVPPRVLIPTFEETYLLARFKHKFARYTKLPISSYDKFEVARDKLQTLEAAQKIDIPVPTTWCVSDFSDLRKISESTCYPVVIKPRSARGAKGVSYARSKEELVRLYKSTVETFSFSSHDYPLIQEYVPGTGFGVSMLFNDGEMRAKFVHRRLLEYPVTGGASVDRVSTHDQKMEQYAQRFLESLNWHGVAMVEFKLNEETKKPVMMEVNPRFWGSLNLAVFAGIDFPYLLYKMAVDGDVKPVLSYKMNLRAVWFFGYLRAIFDSLYKPIKIGEVLKNFLRPSSSNMSYDDVSIGDPLPFVMEPLPFLVQLFKHGELDVYEPIDQALKDVEETSKLDCF